MADPITLAITGAIWEYALKPIADSITKEYGEETKKFLKDKFNKALEKLPLQKKELDVIEAEIIGADVDVLTDLKKFQAFIQNNNEIQKTLEKIVKRDPNISITIEKSYNEFLIDGNNNSISF